MWWITLEDSRETVCIYFSAATFLTRNIDRFGHIGQLFRNFHLGKCSLMGEKQKRTFLYLPGSFALGMPNGTRNSRGDAEKERPMGRNGDTRRI